MSTTGTLPDQDLPWERGRSAARVPIPCFVIAWSLEEPWRVGETLPVRGPGVLGRGSALAEDPAPRSSFERQRPGETLPQPPLGSTRVSRLQLRYAPTKGGEVEVECVGRCPMAVNGTETTSAVLGPGDTLALRNALLLYLSERPLHLPRLRSSSADAGFVFGGPDARGMVGESAEAWRLRDELALAAASGQHVLLTGASGVGKELAARSIHALSERRARPFVARNAATFPPGLVDAEIFGSTKNYPHSGSPERPGLVGEANGGSLFLDEIGELPAELQAHLLRVLDRDGEYQQLGSSQPRRTDLRLIAATNRDPDALKHDFLARFTVRVEVSGFDARREDIPLLLRNVLDAAARDQPELARRFFETRAGRVAEPRIEPRLVEALMHHRYTHHFRELERLAWLTLSTSPGDFLALTPQVEQELRPLVEVAPASVDRIAIEEALARAEGNVTAAARALGLKNRFALYRAMKKHGMSAPRPDED